MPKDEGRATHKVMYQESFSAEPVPMTQGTQAACDEYVKAYKPTLTGKLTVEKL